MKGRLLRAAVLGALVLAPVPARAQCAMCKSALSGSAEAATVGAAFNRAILVLLAAPYLVAAGLGLVLYRQPLGAALARLRGRRR
ncbi:MAG TPA: hypothetical protein VII13_20455 [Vicinamibacteria bacterium]|jgi:hypothetical protein